MGIKAAYLITVVLFLHTAETADFHGATGSSLGSISHVHESWTLGTTVPEDMLRVEIPIVKGLGAAHEAVTTPSAEAQAYYDQGLAMLFAYDWLGAARSFNQALRRDPHLAMAFLGLSFAYSGLADSVNAESTLQQARALAEDSGARERLRIALRRKQLQAIASPDSEKPFGEYVVALDEAIETFPNDPILLLLRGNAAEGFAAAVGQRGTAESTHYYLQVLEIDPSNAAAHHFLIHSSEMANDLAGALEHARRYATLAPAVAHAHHMYGHQLRRTLSISEAIRQFELAQHGQEATYASEPKTLAYDWHYRHNLSLLAATYRQSGNLTLAEKTFKKLSEMDIHTLADEYYRSQLADFFLQTGRYREALAAAGQALTPGSTVGCALSHAIAGSAHDAIEEHEQAAKSLAAADSCARGLNPSWKYLVTPWVEVLRGQIQLKANRQAAVSHFLELEQQMRVLPGADAWSDTLFRLEFIEKTAARSGAWNLAQATARQMREHAPNYYGTHLALAEIAAHQGRTAEAQRERRLARLAQVDP